jgi:methylenetetrahydrofolate reductase (NADPH)|tara:strand:+ start:165039 stop:166004 length:966 start_codon:yes stop_codon:yes gene_type:complete
VSERPLRAEAGPGARAARAAPEQLHGRIVALARNGSYEIAAGEPDTLDAAAEMLPPGCEISITWLPKDDDVTRITAARRIRERGFVPVPHIAARMVESEANLASLLGRLSDAAGVGKILAISGDARHSHGPFADSSAMIASHAFAEARLEEVALGGYPEGHPGLDRGELNHILDAKIAKLRELAIRPSIVTQFCFDAKPIEWWLQDFRQRYEEVPVRIGLAGPAGVRTLMRYARICGIGPSAKALVSRGASIARLLMESTPDPIITDLAGSPNYQSFKPVGFHFFPFGGLERTAEWVTAIAAGRFRLRSSESGFAADIAKP